MSKDVEWCIDLPTPGTYHFDFTYYPAEPLPQGALMQVEYTADDARETTRKVIQQSIKELEAELGKDHPRVVAAKVHERERRRWRAIRRREGMDRMDAAQMPAPEAPIGSICEDIPEHRLNIAQQNARLVELDQIMQTPDVTFVTIAGPDSLMFAGTAQRNPADPNVPILAAHLAFTRALMQALEYYASFTIQLSEQYDIANIGNTLRRELDERFAE